MQAQGKDLTGRCAALEGREAHLVQQCAGAEGRADALQQEKAALEQQLAATAGLLLHKARDVANSYLLTEHEYSKCSGTHSVPPF